jgi:hypothetical protein
MKDDCLEPVIRLFRIYCDGDVVAVGGVLPGGRAVVEWMDEAAHRLTIEFFSTVDAITNSIEWATLMWVGDPARGEPEPLVTSVFELYRAEDVTGISGTGVVAMGIVLPSGRAVMQWITNGLFTTNFYDHHREIEALHGHEGRTRLRYVLGSPKREIMMRETVAA